jgi:hypothetical protein
MDSESVKKDFGPEDLVELADKSGVAIAQVKDGYFMIFTRKHLEGMLEEIAKRGSDKCCVFVKHRTFEN